MPDKKAIIQELISLGKTEEALEQLEQLSSDAILLQSRYNSAKKQYSMGLIDFSEWSRTQAQINYAALEMLNTHKFSADNSTTSGASSHNASAPKVFISYSWDDKPVAQSVKSYLEKNGCAVTIDEDNLEAGASIADFIKNSIKANHYTISIVSQHSLSSGWVGRESIAAHYAEWLANKQFIPVRIDNAFNDPRFFVQTLRTIEDKITELDGLITETQKMRASTGPLDMDRKKLLDLKSSLPDILTRLKEVNTVPIDGEQFESGMKKVLDRIKQS
jgi:hypothetical protein